MFLLSEKAFPVEGRDRCWIFCSIIAQWQTLLSISSMSKNDARKMVVLVGAEG